MYSITTLHYLIKIREVEITFSIIIRNKSPLKRPGLINRLKRVWFVCLWKRRRMAVARAVAVLAVAKPSTVLAGGAQTNRLHKFKPLCFSTTTPSPSSRKLILYSKPGCCLCDGLKEKLQDAFSLSGPHSLNDVDLQVSSFVNFTC